MSFKKDLFVFCLFVFGCAWSSFAVWASLVAANHGPVFAGISGPLVVASLVVGIGCRCVGFQSLQLREPLVVAHGPSCSTARGIFWTRDRTQCPLHWQSELVTVGITGATLTCSFLHSCGPTKNTVFFFFQPILISFPHVAP